MIKAAYISVRKDLRIHWAAATADEKVHHLAKTNAVQTKAFHANARGGLEFRSIYSQHESVTLIDGCNLHVTTCD